MRKLKLLSALIGLFLPFLAVAGAASAQTFRSGETATVNSDETVNSTLFVSGRTVDVAGTVDGDLFCAGMNITVSGTVRGDILCAGQSVIVSGTVEGDVRLAGQNVVIGGQVEGNATVATSLLSLESDANVGDDLSVAATDMVLNGQIGRDVSMAGATATIGNRIGRNVKASVESLHLRGQANIGGDLTYTSARDAEIDEGAQVSGETNRTDPPETKGTFETPLVTGLGFVLYFIISLLILSLVIALLFPSVLHDTTGIAVLNPLKVLLTGIVAGLVVPILIVTLMVTVIGIPLALLMLGLWLLILFLSGPFFAYYAGRMMLRDQTNPLLIMALGSLVVLILYFVPVLGIFVWLAAIWMGSGMILLQLMRRTPRPSYVVAHETAPKPKSKK